MATQNLTQNVDGRSRKGIFRRIFGDVMAARLGLYKPKTVSQKNKVVNSYIYYFDENEKENTDRLPANRTR